MAGLTRPALRLEPSLAVRNRIKPGDRAPKAVLEAANAAELTVVHHREAQRLLTGDDLTNCQVLAGAQLRFGGGAFPIPLVEVPERNGDAEPTGVIGSNRVQRRPRLSARGMPPWVGRLDGGSTEK